MANITREFINLRAQEIGFKREHQKRPKKKNEPGGAVLARERGGLAQIPETKQSREDKRGAMSWGEK